MGRRVDAEQLVAASDIAQRIGLPRAQDVHTRRRRDPTFPEPVAVIGGGPSYGILVWYWPDVATWARRHGFTPGPGGTVGRPPKESARSQQAELVRLREEQADLAALRRRLDELSQLRQHVEALDVDADAGDEAQPPAPEQN